MSAELQALSAHIDAATGADSLLDGEVARLLNVDGKSADYTASVDRCIDLIHACLPGWAWHVGWKASGILPYATLHQGEHTLTASAPTVPLALLKALCAHASRSARLTASRSGRRTAPGWSLCTDGDAWT